MKKKSFLSKHSGPSPILATGENNLVADTKNWYAERYETILVQRNILFIVMFFSICAIISGLFVIEQLSISKTVEPFVIEVEDKTGITNVVNPLSRIELTTNESLNTYFILKYIRARETYNAVDYQYNYGTIVRLLSTQSIYISFKNYINDNPKSPIKIYGTTTSTSLKVRSVQFIPSESKAQVRFTITETGGSSQGTMNKIATINFAYVQMEMTNDERYVNPLGFQVTGYRVDDEVL
jgi:type IV secretion system protein VirB8